MSNICLNTTTTPTVKLLFELVDEIRCRGPITSFNNVPPSTLYTMFTPDTFSLIDGKYVIFGTDDAIIVSNVVTNVSFDVTLPADPTVTEWKEAEPFFFVGPVIAIHNELMKFNEGDKPWLRKFPCIMIFERIDERVNRVAKMKVGTTATMNIYFMDVSNYKDWDVQEHYENVTDPMHLTVDKFIEAVETNPHVVESLFKEREFLRRVHSNWGLFMNVDGNPHQKGHTTRIITEDLSGISLPGFTIPIKKSFDKCDNTLCL